MAAGREYTCAKCRKPKPSGKRETKTDLSFRQKQIMALVGKAMANKEIACELRLTEGTIKEYLFHIFKKLNVKSRTELALLAAKGAAETKSAEVV